MSGNFHVRIFVTGHRGMVGSAIRSELSWNLGLEHGH